MKKKVFRHYSMFSGLGWKLPVIGKHWFKNLKLVGKPGTSF